MGDITLRDLLELRTGITNDVRHDVEAMEKRVCERIDDVKVAQANQGVRIDRHGQELGELRTALEERTKATALLDLTPRQKKLLWGGLLAVGGACLEGLRHIFGWVLPWIVKGAQHS